jgi:hypothetical protein
VPFSKLKEDPELLEAMRSAFYRVCDVLRLNGDCEDAVTELIVTKIVELAKAGELDPERLCIDVLADFQTPPQDAGLAGMTPRTGQPSS